MKQFVKEIKKGDRRGSLNHLYEPTISDEVFEIVSKEWNVNGNVCEVLDK